MDKLSIIESVKQAGVVGAGGAGFPTYVKIDCSVDTVIVNAAECEPLLRVDQELLINDTNSILKGIEAVLKASGAKQGIIGIKAKHKKVIESLKNATMAFNNIEIFELGDFYPAGDEQVLVYEITGRIVPEGGIPLMTGVVVINVETLLNVYNSLLGKPVVYKYVTVTGQVKNPVTVKVPVGTKISELIEIAGGTSLANYVLIDGGPMMGKVTKPQAPVTKTTKGVIVLPEGHKIEKTKSANIQWALKRSMSACCQCRMCTDLCPRNLLGHHLEPHRILRAASYGIASDVDAITSAVLCSECGVCDVFACPMGLSPRQINMRVKRELALKGYKNTHKFQPKKASDARNFRKVPVKRLVDRLNIKIYDLPAPLNCIEYKPREVELLLSQHIGKPSKPHVKEGDYVKKGQIVAVIPEGAIGSNIHASIDGVVKLLDDRRIIISCV